MIRRWYYCKFSNRVFSRSLGAISSFGRALPWHGRGGRFESGMVHTDDSNRRGSGNESSPYEVTCSCRTRGRKPYRAQSKRRAVSIPAWSTTSNNLKVPSMRDGCFTLPLGIDIIHKACYGTFLLPYLPS